MVKNARKTGFAGRRKDGVKDFDPAVKGDHNVVEMDLLSLFKIFFPLNWLQTVMVCNINKNTQLDDEA
jgi:hypothetical protein